MHPSIALTTVRGIGLHPYPWYRALFQWTYGMYKRMHGELVTEFFTILFEERLAGSHSA